MTDTFEAHQNLASRRVDIYRALDWPHDGPGTFLAPPIGPAELEQYTVEPGQEPPAWVRLSFANARALRDALDKALGAAPMPMPAVLTPDREDRLIRIIEKLADAA